MFIYNLYKQLKTLYYIKTHIDNIYKTFTIELDENETKNENNSLLQFKLFNDLKQLIFMSGSLYIKFFQWYISKLKANIINDNDPYTIHIKKFITFFEDIFEQCPYHDLEHTKQIFRLSMCGIELDDYIDMSTFKVIASGSIGQVYYGCRIEDGLDVAIKVKHPNIEQDLENQYELIKLIKLLQSISYFRNKYNILFNIDDFLEDINLQCDFNNEANNTKLFIENFKDSSKYIVFPEVLYQSNDMLISKYIDGSSTDTLNDMQKFQTSINFMCFFEQMLFCDNFIHGDLHCKNWKVKYNEKTNITQIIIYDCGICFKNISTEITLGFWDALSNYDIDKLIIILKDFIKESNNINTNYFNNKIFDNDINYLFNNIINQSLGSSLIMKLLLNLFRLNDLIVHKFLLNFTILICVVEEYMKENNIISKYNICMFELINNNNLDIITFCDLKKCYPKVKDIIQLNMKDNYKRYKKNSKSSHFANNNNMNENNNNDSNDSNDSNKTIESCETNESCESNKTNETKKLFNSISLSGLIFKPPE